MLEEYLIKEEMIIKLLSDANPLNLSKKVFNYYQNIYIYFM